MPSALNLLSIFPNELAIFCTSLWLSSMVCVLRKAMFQLNVWAAGLCEVLDACSEGLENAGHGSLPGFYLQEFSSPTSKIFSTNSSVESDATLSGVVNSEPP